MTHSNVDTLKQTEFLRIKYIVAILSLCVAIGLLAWSLYHYKPNPNFYGPRAIYSMLILSITLALLGRVILLRMLKQEIAKTDVLHYHLRSTWRLLFLFDITAPLYLAAGVLIGPPAAVLLALSTQTVLQGFTLSRRFVSWPEVCYRIASIALIALISSYVYSMIGGPPQTHFVDHFQPIAETKEFLGSILAATVMMLLLMVFSLSCIVQLSPAGLKAAS